MALDRGCKRVADDLVEVLRTRPGVEVRPGAELQLGVTRCDDGSATTIEVESVYPGLAYGTSIYEERRRYNQRAWATAEVVVSGQDAPVTLLGKAERADRGQWISEGDLDLPAVLSQRDALRRDLAHDLADQVAPLPETIRRMVYADPEPGTARQLHNQAVEAEQAADLQRALDLAQQAYAANPSRAEMVYIQDLKAHAESVGYALRTDPPPQ